MNSSQSTENEVRQIFTESLSGIQADAALVEEYMSEIAGSHTKPSRHYHNLIHLVKLANELETIKTQIQDWPAILFAILYHDIIYNPLSSNNEEKSAQLAEKRLSSLQVSPTITSNCVLHILATKSHELSNQPDTNFFTDADLSILGADAAAYDVYAGLVRKEFSFYPNLIYNAGRKKVLQQFLHMPFIFKTSHFREKYENSARRNIELELETLSK